MTALWGEDVVAEGTSRVTWEIEPVGDSCRLVVTHDQLREGANDQLYGGWPMILSGLKTLLETGEPLTTPGSLRHAGRHRASGRGPNGRLHRRRGVSRRETPFVLKVERTFHRAPVAAMRCAVLDCGWR